MAISMTTRIVLVVGLGACGDLGNHTHVLARVASGVDSLSVDGSTIWWTTSSSILYRLSPTDAAPVELATSSDFDSLTEDPFVFADGRVYWLTRPPNTTLDSIDEAGGPITIVGQGPRLDGAYSLEHQASDLYWVGMNAHGDYSIEINVLHPGGMPQEAVATPMDSFLGFAVDDTGIYWARQSQDCQAEPGAIVKVALDGTTSTDLVVSNCPSEPQLVGSTLIWTEGDQTYGDKVAMPESGGPMSSVTMPDVGYAYALDASGTYWGQPSSHDPCDNRTTVCPAVPEEMWHAPLEGGSTTKIADGLASGDVVDVRSNDSSLFWVQVGGDADEIMTMPK